jgi:hypothetical protein
MKGGKVVFYSIYSYDTRVKTLHMYILMVLTPSDGI